MSFLKCVDTADDFFRCNCDVVDGLPQKRSAAEEHLGMLGPLLRAEVGDTVHVHLLNRLSVPVSIHAHGLRYAKNAEGAPYADGTSGAYPV